MFHYEHEHHRCQQRSRPIGPVDCDVHPSPVARRDQFVDGGVDRGVLAADPHPRDESGHIQPADPTLSVTCGHCRQASPDQIDPQRDHEEVLTTPSVREPSEEECSGHLAEQVDGSHGERDRSRREVESVLARDDAGGVARDRDLEAVEDPCHAQCHNEAGVERRPTEPVDPGRDQAAPGRSGRHPGLRLDRRHMPHHLSTERFVSCK